MILLRLNGGLGNQMFQYAFSRYLSYKYGQQICFDFSQFSNSDRNYCLDLFPLEADLILDLKCVKNLQDYKSSQLQEEDFRFTEEALSVFDGYDLNNRIVLISGYWQSPKYFDKISDIIHDNFQNIYKLSGVYCNIEQMIKTTESVMVHIRRGDYLYKDNLQKHGIVDVDYITKGMSYFKTKLPGAFFFIFSDDLSWCRRNIPQCDNIIFIEKDLDEGRSSFTLMRQCKHFLISNSTYSWWAAWLSESPLKRILCPKKWFCLNNSDSLDLIPSKWIRL